MQPAASLSLFLPAPTPFTHPPPLLSSLSLRSYAIDLETERPINATHAAVLFDDRVTQPNFLAPTSSLPDAPGKGDARDGQGRNCSYFALASIDKVQKRLIAMCDDLRARGVADLAGAPAAPPKPEHASAG